MIRFNVPLIIGDENKYIAQAMDSRNLCGDGPLTHKVNEWLELRTGVRRALFTTSCTHALEMAALLSDIGPGDDVIMSSYTFVSTANPFVMRGARIVFVDIRPDTMNIDETLIEQAITPQTKAIVAMHYAGIACEMDTIMDIAKRHHLLVIEDAAQAVMATYKGRALGSIGHLGCYSFHETKNYQCGEGGALLINDERFVDRAEIIREKGTDRSRFLRGQVDKYTWVDVGSSYLPSELNAAFLFAQLNVADYVNVRRKQIWDAYYSNLLDLELPGVFDLPVVPPDCQHNAHMFYIKVKNLKQRQDLIRYLHDNEVQSVFHYIPLHSAQAGKKFGTFSGEDVHTTIESERLIRLPMHMDLTLDDVNVVCSLICDWILESGDIEVWGI